MTLNNTRNVGLDVVRCVALLCVVCVHFFLHTGCYKIPVEGKRMFLAMTMRNNFMICVPLFLVLTGYLVRATKLTGRYCLKILRIIGIYVLTSLCCGIYRILWTDQDFAAADLLWGIVGFYAAPYSWYVNMYLGLFFVIPFLNILYDHLPDDRHKRYLLLVLVCVTMLPTMLNIYRFDSLSWWLHPASSAEYQQIVPNYWSGIYYVYHVTYFFIGRYLRDYPLRTRPIVTAAAIVVVALLIGAFNYYRSYGANFIAGLWQGYGSLFVGLQTVLVFSFFTQLRYDRLPNWCAAVIGKISLWSLGAYLVSYVFDHVIYGVINAAGGTFLDKFPLFFVTVPVIFVAATLLSGLLELIYQQTLGRLVKRWQMPKEKTGG